MARNSGDEQPTDDKSLIGRAALWALMGGVFGLRGSKLANWAILGPLGERVFGFTLEELLAEGERQRRQHEIQKRLMRLFQSPMAAGSEQASAKNIPQEKAGSIPIRARAKQVATEKDSKWREVIPHPCVVLIVGKRGSGKSGLGYRLLELHRYEQTPYVVGIPKQAERLLPDWIGIAQELRDIPPGSIVLVDEAYITYHSRESLQMQSREMSRIVNLSRQRNLTLIFVTQEARQVDKNITSQANVIVFKEPAILQVRFDRPEFNDIATQAKLAFSKISGDKRMWSYVYSPDADFLGLLENSLPTFWSSELSHAFASAEPLLGRRLAKKVSKGDRKSKAKELRQNGYSYRQIASILGIHEATAYNYVNDYPYRHKSS